MDLSVALNKEYHLLADAGAPLVQIEEPAIHQVIADPNQKIKPQQWVEAFNIEVKGLRDKCEVWCHTCWGSPAAQRVASKDQSYKAALPYLDQIDCDVITVEGAFNKGMDLEHFGTMISKNKKIALGVISHRTLAGRAAGGDRRSHPPRAQTYRAGAADPDQRLRLRPPVDEPHACVLQNGRAHARHQYRAQGTGPAGSLYSGDRPAAFHGAAFMSDTIMNLRGLKCPLPTLRVKKMLSSLKSGDIIVAECTDPLTIIDIPNLLRETGDTLEGKTEDGSVLTFRIRKK